MPAFKKFGPGDQLDNVLLMEPKYDLASGTSGWRGASEGSASVSLYGGARRSSAHVFSSISYQSIAPNAGQTGDPTRGLPMTASIHYVWMTNEELTAAQRTSERWGYEHWKTVQRLYQDYQARDPDYVTASYDYYCLYFNKASQNIMGAFLYQDDGTTVISPSGSFTMESWINPFLTASSTNDFTIQSQSRTYWFGITGSTGRLALSSSLGEFTSSFGPSPGDWSHIACTFNSTTRTGSFYVNLVHAGDFFTTGNIPPPPAASTLYAIGNQVYRPSAFYTEDVYTSGVLGKSFHGLIGETRLWTVSRTWSQISGTWNTRLSGSALSGTTSCYQFREGPLSFVNVLAVPLGSATPMGSGTVDHGRRAASVSYYSWGFLNGFRDRSGPVWLPSDNDLFTVDKTYAPAVVSTLSSSGGWQIGSTFAYPKRSDDVTRMVVIDVPNTFYGRQIVPESVVITDRCYSSGSHALVRTLIDDGRGGLFVSGSMFSGSTRSYRGVEWNKVGNVFYGEGLIVIRDPALLDFGRTDGVSSHPNDTLQLTFKGHSRIPVKTLMCRIDRGEFNATNNPTFYTVNEVGDRLRRHASGSIRVTTVGLYNSDRELVGVARLAEPVRIRPRDRINIRLRMDF